MDFPQISGISKSHEFNAMSDTVEPIVEPESTALSVTQMPEKASAQEPVVAEEVSKKKKAPGRGRALLNDALLAFILVGSVVAAILSTQVAMQAVEDAEKFEKSAAASSAALSKTLQVAASHSNLKGKDDASAREEIFAPALAHLQSVLSETQSDPERLDQAAAAAMQLAMLQAKTGNSGCVASLQATFHTLAEMSAGNYPLEKYPDMYELCFKSTIPMDWATMKDASLETQGQALVFAFMNGNSTFGELSLKYPEETVFSSAYASLLKISAALQSLMPERHAHARAAWVQTSDLLESCLSKKPGDEEFQARLVEALVGASNLQRRADKPEAIKNLTRAVEVRQMMVDANPEDKDLEKELSKLKNNLETLAGS